MTGVHSESSPDYPKRTTVLYYKLYFKILDTLIKHPQKRCNFKRVMCPNKLTALSDHFGSLWVRRDYWFYYAGASLYLYLSATRSGGSCHSGLFSTLIQSFLLFYCNLIMQGTIESKVFSRRANICVHFWMTSDQITRSVPNRDTRPFVFFVGSRILCRTRFLVLIVLMSLLSMCNLFFRIGPAHTLLFWQRRVPHLFLVRPWCVMLLTHHVNSIFVRRCHCTLSAPSCNITLHHATSCYILLHLLIIS